MMSKTGISTIYPLRCVKTCQLGTILVIPIGSVKNSDYEMGIGRFFKSLIDSEIMGEEILKAVHDLFAQTSKYNGGDTPHDILYKTYLGRLRARKIDISDAQVLTEAMTDTYLLACLPPGKNIRALALHCLNQERPDIINQYPKFSAEYDRLMKPLKSGDSDISSLYKRYNPDEET